MAVPHYAAIMDVVSAKGIVYYCTDDFASFPNTDRNAIQSMENRILSRANIVFAVSEPLVESKRRRNPNTFLSPHGVDTQHFRKALLEKTLIPEDIAQIRRPTAGFFGLLEQWFDIELLKYCASQLKDVSFVLIGRTVQNVADISALPNVHFLGPKPYEIIPNYLKAFDVGLIPFRMNDTIMYSNPLKFKEYLAGGKPVVSVRIAAFEKYKHLAFLTDTYETFAASIRAAINQDSPEKVHARVSAMDKESWDAKFEDISAQVRAHIPRHEREGV
jgi:glycosyltransferase involved in cell wall biosynthesis